jgi:hypothetical protein
VGICAVLGHPAKSKSPAALCASAPFDEGGEINGLRCSNLLCDERDEKRGSRASSPLWKGGDGRAAVVGDCAALGHPAKSKSPAALCASAPFGEGGEIIGLRSCSSFGEGGECSGLRFSSLLR